MASMKEHVQEIIKSVGSLDELSAKKVREELEKKMGLEPGELKSQKTEISKLIDEVLEEQEDDKQDDTAADEEDEDEDEDEKPKKGKKRPAEAPPEDGKQPKSTCTTRSGDEAPKNVKKMQESIKGMSTSKFLSQGPTLEIDLCGNTLRGPPRTFSSGNKGWYMNGKVEIPVGDKMVWAQVGMNITIPGSSSWK